MFLTLRRSLLYVLQTKDKNPDHSDCLYIDRGERGITCRFDSPPPPLHTRHIYPPLPFLSFHRFVNFRSFKIGLPYKGHSCDSPISKQKITKMMTFPVGYTINRRLWWTYFVVICNILTRNVHRPPECESQHGQFYVGSTLIYYTFDISTTNKIHISYNLLCLEFANISMSIEDRNVLN